MTPEEKLLALIQQDKRHADGAAPSPVVPKTQEPVSPVPAPSLPPVVTAAPAPSTSPVQSKPEIKVTPLPVTANDAANPGKEEKKLKLADAPAVKPVIMPSAVTAPPKTASPSVDEPRQEVVAEPVGEVSFVSLSSSSSGVPLVLLNRALGVVVIMMIALVAFRISSIRAGISETIEKQVSGAGNRPIQSLVVSEEAVPALDAYLDKVSSRNIFAPKVTIREGEPKPEPAGSPKDLKLVAVSMDSTSVEESMAIIKNKGDSKTYFVKSGQTIGSTEYVLDKVFSDHVVIKLRKQEFELK